MTCIPDLTAYRDNASWHTPYLPHGVACEGNARSSHSITTLVTESVSWHSQCLWKPNVAVLTGDAMGVFKVWQFLNSWGIINYQAGAGADEDADGVPVKVQPAGKDNPLSPAHLPIRCSAKPEHWPKS